MSKNPKNVTQQIRTEQITKKEIESVPTTKREFSSESTQNFFVTYKQNVNKYFESIENSIPKYYQTIHELEQEYLHAWENMFNANISIQKEFASKIGLKTISPAASEFISEATDSAIKARSVRDKIILESIDTAKENIKAWNNQSDAFAETNRKIAQFWISLFTTRQS